ncbi:hypothetical protein CTI12_AA395590 [Artemisia annua]|uniref:Uncharacterized protein n=1 Tax=Artemisia annua TaxID=35608 RepID=A0A2U1MCK5_ARTAN|nr:hypothetical protein CTI12_AA395590 [Artemisia annua]
MGILLALVAQLHRSLPEGSIKGLRFAVGVFVVNFGVGWWSLQQSTLRGHHIFIHSRSVAVQVTFYLTMILSPLILLSRITTVNISSSPSYETEDSDVSNALFSVQTHESTHECKHDTSGYSTDNKADVLQIAVLKDESNDETDESNRDTLGCSTDNKADLPQIVILED